MDLMCVRRSQRRGLHARIVRLERFEEGHFGNYGLEMPSAYQALPGQVRERNKAAGALFAPRPVNQSYVIQNLMGMKSRRYTVELKRRRLNSLLKLTRHSPGTSGKTMQRPMAPPATPTQRDRPDSAKGRLVAEDSTVWDLQWPLSGRRPLISSGLLFEGRPADSTCMRRTS